MLLALDTLPMAIFLYKIEIDDVSISFVSLGKYFFHGIGREPIIWVGKEDVVTFGQGDAAFASKRESLVYLIENNDIGAQMGIMLIYHSFKYLDRIVLRAIVDKNEFYIGTRLTKDAMSILFDILLHAIDACNQGKSVLKLHTLRHWEVLCRRQQ